MTKKRVKNNGELPQYYYENTHPAIIDRDIWNCVQVEFQRQDSFVKEHRMGCYHQHSEEIPLVGKIICGSCRDTFLFRELMRIEKGANTSKETAMKLGEILGIPLTRWF